MVAPIPKALLIHEVTLETFAESEWGGTFAAPVTVSFVRLEPKTALVRGSTGDNVTSNTLLFWDSTHSTPCDFTEDSKVTFNGKKMIVAAVDDFFDESKLHHREVRLL